jgi:hypothetical protein
MPFVCDFWQSLAFAGHYRHENVIEQRSARRSSSRSKR